ncbi:3-methyladenine DNA glycosylase/8-oxoguanine DNA glycosylase [Motilibacter rhizosphaerae]|uniref:3-methyladenine DNA glycosylase/8-oxoguanine DNA glycosylase n=1 Tax=Motilibacter rhizosphaerae TaxID=598652 RepID=A0A4Q7NSZ5_9ACTN|nr:hypothetical protein [Motilibacter rhizosphaerae]RZS90175.1 3-methyladenine DNA glycosylase/8-oxoguanine DNA glycosylase [Motilibacter rhizosphaerae]
MTPQPRTAPLATSGARPDATGVHDPGHLLDLRAVLGPLRRGGGDPAYAVEPAVGGGLPAVWRASLLPSGVASLRLAAEHLASGTVVTAQAWGPGAEEAVARVPDLLGASDASAGFAPSHPVLAESVRRHRGWRVPRTGCVVEALVPAVLEQKVTSTEARRAWRDLVRAYGVPAPGPTPVPMWAPPAARDWCRVPSWTWHQAGVDDKRAATIVRSCAVAPALERTLALPADEAAAVLCSLPGIGPWTAAEVLQRAHGSADHVSVGDLHLPGLVGWALAAEPWADDARMLELLEPYRGARYRAVRMVELALGGGLVPPRPRRAPRYAVRDFRRI